MVDMQEGYRCPDRAAQIQPPGAWSEVLRVRTRRRRRVAFRDLGPRAALSLLPEERAAAWAALRLALGAPEQEDVHGGAYWGRKEARVLFDEHGEQILWRAEDWEPGRPLPEPLPVGLRVVLALWRHFEPGLELG